MIANRDLLSKAEFMDRIYFALESKCEAQAFQIRK
jgi:hypothetical protein